MRIDLSADIGEAAPGAHVEDDAALFGCVTSVNVVCGVHAGDPPRIRRILRLARDSGTRVGAHPSVPDREGLGRRDVAISASDLEDWVLFQIAALGGLARAERLRLHHVKPHGALYHRAAEDEHAAEAIVRAVRLLDERLIVVGPPGSALLEAATRSGLGTRAEAFADRAYTPAGRLVSRDRPGALLTDPEEVGRRAVRLVQEQRVYAVDGTDLRIAAETLCVHADTPGAARIARALRDALERAGIVVAAE